MKISAPTGSILGGNQQLSFFVLSRRCRPPTVAWQYQNLLFGRLNS
jgi:hypothetical protein